MRITESKLRSVIRSVIRESSNEYFSGRDASQRHESRKHPDKPYMYDDDFVHAKEAAETLVDYYNRLPNRSNDGGIDKKLLKMLVHRAFSSGFLNRKELQKDLVEQLRSLSTGSYDRYIGKNGFWREVHDRFSEIIEQAQTL